MVVCDYEKTSAVDPEVSHILDSEVDAVAAFRTLSDEDTDRLDPVLVTGSTVLVDDDLYLVFHEYASQWLQEKDYEVELRWGALDGYHPLGREEQIGNPEFTFNSLPSSFRLAIPSVWSDTWASG